MGKLTISMAMFNSYVGLPESICGKYHCNCIWKRIYLWSQVKQIFWSSSPGTLKLDSTNYCGKASCTMTKNGLTGSSSKLFDLAILRELSVQMADTWRSSASSAWSGWKISAKKFLQQGFLDLSPQMHLNHSQLYSLSSGRLRAIGKHCPLRHSQVEKLKLSTTGGSG